MCGLFGGISCFLSSREIELVQDLGTVSVLRGKYGAGIVIIPVHREAKIRILRSEFPATDILFSSNFNNFVQKRVGVLMGHTRHPTSGDMNIKSVHPHECGEIVGMHNGTLTDIAGAKVTKAENDSKLLFTFLNNRGVDETFSNVKGSYACTWINKAEKTLNFLRNEERSLYIACVSGSENTIYWASEQGFLECVLSRDCLPTEKVLYFPLPVNKLLTFDIYNKDVVCIKEMRNINVIPKPVSTATLQVVPHITPVNGAPANGNSIALLPPPTNIAPANVDAIPLVGAKYVTVPGSHLTHPELIMALHLGCITCQSAQTMSDYLRKNALTWISRSTFRCYDCTHESNELDTGMPIIC